MDLEIKVDSFNGKAMVKNGEVIIRRIYKDFIRLINKLPKLEEINGIKLNRITRITSPTINFILNDGSRSSKHC
jgi:hypothetical protein